MRDKTVNATVRHGASPDSNSRHVIPCHKDQEIYELSSAFIATAEARAEEAYKQGIVEGSAEDIVELIIRPRTDGGFAPKAVQWGIDGTNRCGDGLRCPPFDATAVHALDHPDYVLLYLLEGKRSSLLQHQDRNSVTAPFAKIILYPLFREERMVPREVNLTSGEGMTRFTLAFKNPDGTAYRFHNAEFSFTLNFIS